MYKLRDKTADELGADLIVHKNPEAVRLGINPFDHGSAVHTDTWKTDGLKQALEAGKYDLAFSGFKNPLPIIITGVLMLVMIYVGCLLLLLPGIYLMIAYALALPLVIERGLSPWQALETSRKAISQHWFKVLGLNLVLGLIVGLSAIPLGIGMIWTVPLWAIASGVLYRTIFGVLPVAE